MCQALQFRSINHRAYFGFLGNGWHRLEVKASSPFSPGSVLGVLPCTLVRMCYGWVYVYVRDCVRRVCDRVCDRETGMRRLPGGENG